MTVLALGSLKASPGVTTAALALGAVWPEARPLLLAEADPDGGVLAARFELSTEPGLATLAPALRREASPDHVRRHTQTLPGGTPVLIGPSSPDQARVSLAACADRLASLLPRFDADVLLDCGRLTTGSPAGPLLRAADRLLVVTRPRLEELQYLTHRLPALQETVRDVGVLLIGDDPYRRAEVEEAFSPSKASVTQLAHDPRAAGALNGMHDAGARSLPRSALVRSARQMLEDLPGLPAAAPPEVFRPHQQAAS